MCRSIPLLATPMLEIKWTEVLNIRGAFKKFCNSTIKNNRNVTNYTLFFNTTPPEFNAFATFFWQTVNSTKIEIFGLPLQPLLDSFLAYSFLHYHGKFQNFLNACPLSCRWNAQGSCLEGETEDFYFSGINCLPEKCRKCIELSRDYIEK